MNSKLILIYLCFPILLFAQNERTAPKSLLEFMGTDNLHQYSKDDLLLKDHLGAINFELEGKLRFSRVMLSGEGDLRIQLGLTATLTKMLLEDLGVYGAALQGRKASLHFKDASVDWKVDEYGLKGNGSWVLASIAGSTVDRTLTDVHLIYSIDQSRGDHFQMSIKTAKHWYYFEYHAAILVIYSNNEAFNQKITKLPKKERTYKIANNVKYNLVLGNNAMYVNFLKKFE